MDLPPRKSHECLSGTVAALKIRKLLLGLLKEIPHRKTNGQSNEVSYLIGYTVGKGNKEQISASLLFVNTNNSMSSSDFVSLTFLEYLTHDAGR